MILNFNIILVRIFFTFVLFCFVSDCILWLVHSWISGPVHAIHEAVQDPAGDDMNCMADRSRQCGAIGLNTRGHSGITMPMNTINLPT